MSLMKKNILPLLAALCFVACQNDAPAPATTNTQQLPAELKIAPEQVKAANEKAKTLQKSMRAFLQEVNAASASMKGTQKVELEAIASQLNDVMGKEEMMAKGIEAAASSDGTDASALNTGAVPPPGVLQDYIQSIDDYGKFLDDLKGQFEALKNGAAPKK